MKVLHVVHGYFPESAGGTEVYVRDLMAAQRAAGHEVRLLTGSMVHWPRCGIEELELEGVKTYRLHRDDWHFDHFAKAYHPVAAQIVSDVLQAERPDLVHVHHWIRITSNVVEIADRLGIPAVVTLHDLYTSCPRVFRVRRDEEACFRELSVASCFDCAPRFGHESDAEVAGSIELHRDQFRAEIGLARAVLAASSTTADLVCTATGLPRERVTLLPFGYTPRWSVPPSAAPLTARQRLRFGYWGNVTARKGAHVLLQAFRMLHEAAPGRTELHVFGKVDTPAFEAQLAELAHGLPVTFHGRYDYAQLAAADLHVAVMPMVCFETFGFVLDEAFELRLPCIVTGIGALPERAGGAALVVPPRDAAALAAAMRVLLDEPARREALVRAIPASTPDAATHAARLLEVYRAALAAPRPVGVELVSAERRAALLLLQRESAHARVVPESGPS